MNINISDFMVICVIGSHLQMYIQLFSVRCDILRICWALGVKSRTLILWEKSKIISQCGIKSNIKIEKNTNYQIVWWYDEIISCIPCSSSSVNQKQIVWTVNLKFHMNPFSPFIYNMIEWNSHKHIVCLLRDVMQCLVNVIQTLRMCKSTTKKNQ